MKKQYIASIIKEINDNRSTIIRRIPQESIDVYLWLKKEYARKNILQNKVFQFVLRSYYGLDNAGLSLMQKTKFFKLMVDENTNLKEILNEFYKLPRLGGQNTIQFSFATKLIHTIDNTKPIFDANIAAATRKRVIGYNMEEKIKSCESIYLFLQDLYKEILKKDKTKEIISDFQKSFNLKPKEITNEKILDFFMWSLGKIKAYYK